MHLTITETATILAALRFYQESGLADDPTKRSDAIHDIATNGDTQISFDSTAIDQLCEALNFATQETALAFYKVRPSDDNLSFLAWGALTPLTTEDPHSDPAEPLHYRYGPTPEKAVSGLHSEMNSQYGMRQWVRQYSESSPEHGVPISSITSVGWLYHTQGIQLVACTDENSHGYRAIIPTSEFEPIRYDQLKLKQAFAKAYLKRPA